MSISIYCTSWTFYGAVGSAARNGLEFATIYLGPTLVFVGWWLLLRKLVRIGQLHRITSIADMISSRYGKSARIAALVTLIAVAASTPYIALQLKAMTNSFQVISGVGAGRAAGHPERAAGLPAAFWIAAGMALFTILFGTRNIDANERHHGVVAAIAVEAVVKLVALLAVGLLVVFGIAGGPADIFARMPPEHAAAPSEVFGPRWVTLTFLAGAAVICLPRQFQVTVVESDRRAPPAHRVVAVPAVPAADQPVRAADRDRRAELPAAGRQPGHVRADAADVGAASTASRCSPSSAASRRPPRW